MKKRTILALILVLMMAVSSFGCTAPAAQSATETETAAETAAETATTGEEAAAVETQSDLLTQDEVATVEENEWGIANLINDGSQTKEELYELAKEEGAVTLYSISSRCGKVAESFNAEYPGVVCEAFDISSDELIQRVTTEYTAGQYVADVVHCKDLDGSVYQELVLNHVFHNYFPTDICDSIDPAYLTYAMPLYWELNQWFYNGNLIDEAPVTSWWQLTEEQWDNNLLMQDPINNTNYMAVFTAFLQYEDEIAADYEALYGEPLTDYQCGIENAAYELLYRLFKDDRVIFMSSSDEVCEQTAGTGVTEVKLGYGASSKVRKNADNGWALVPINITPSTGIPNPNNLYIVDNCPHPNAAKLLVRWICGEADGTGEGFTPFNTLGGWSVRNNVQLAEGSTPLIDLNIWKFDPMFVYTNFLHMQDYLIQQLAG